MPVTDGWGALGWGSSPWGENGDVTVVVSEGPLAVVESPTFSIQIDGNEFVNADEDHNLLISSFSIIFC